MRIFKTNIVSDGLYTTTCYQVSRELMWKPRE
jgi:hypothetical protein